MSHQPSFHSHVLSQIGLQRGAQLSIEDYREALLLRSRYFNLALTALLLLGMYALALQLGLGRWTALVPGVLLVALPRVVFHAHALWSEPLHLVFEVGFLAAACAMLAGRSRAWLVLAGLFLGFALLTRATLLYFVPVVACMVAVRGQRGLKGRHRWITAAAHVGLLLGGLGLVVAPQYAKNYHDGWGLRLSTNIWQNVEYGIRRRTKGDSPGLGMRWSEAKRLYVGADGSKLRGRELLLQRELLARKRTLEFVESVPVSTLFMRQWRKPWTMLLEGNEELHFAVREQHWGADTARIAPWAIADKSYWQLLVVLGLLALPFCAFRSYGWGLVALFVGYYMAAFTVVSINARMALQLAPAWCLLVVCGAARIVTLLRARGALK